MMSDITRVGGGSNRLVLILKVYRGSTHPKVEIIIHGHRIVFCKLLPGVTDESDALTSIQKAMFP